ncbi:tRNA lysidine(34) synthetase TilS [Spirulina subsalsa FACHB-351]|uniref:tRNA(Ile)-lysidine synthase n=1 Tax=Spirulina subsalsa FACHB-351 TaxID=234711 RepID=A0ABT3L8V2_9CYAN|nr:tRNA lysidine(34) synthetase TilS [Spirulina subsalsa]MCW6037934.1 tRNA lysidine(34) synthetase TilS [Spirulina subsalsa FACHB-351]
MVSPLWTPLHTRLHQTLRQRPVLPPQQKILVAVSGGQDSLCLLQLLWDLGRKWHWELRVAHCDHGWPEDQGLADHVRDWVSQYPLPLFCSGAVALPQTEAAARAWRYQVLLEIARGEGCPVIVTGHTQSDRAETLLYHLIRGTGTTGLTALPWQRSLSPEVQLVRPLLNMSRAETGQFCQDHHLPVWSDPYNQNLQYARNRLRQEIIPALQTHFNPQVETALAQTAEILQGDLDYLEQLTTEACKTAFDDQLPRFNRLPLQTLPLALKRRVVRRFLQQYLPHHPNFEQIEAVTQLIQAPNRSRTSTLTGGMWAEVDQTYVQLTAPS